MVVLQPLHLMIPRPDSARLMAHDTSRHSLNRASFRFQPGRFLLSYHDSPSGRLQLLFLLKLTTYHVNLVHALLHLSMLLSPMLRLTVSACSLPGFLSITFFRSTDLSVSIFTGFNLLFFSVTLAWCSPSFLCHLWFFFGAVLMAFLFPRSPVSGVGLLLSS